MFKGILSTFAASQFEFKDKGDIYFDRSVIQLSKYKKSSK